MYSEARKEGKIEKALTGAFFPHATMLMSAVMGIGLIHFRAGEFTSQEGLILTGIEAIYGAGLYLLEKNNPRMFS